MCIGSFQLVKGHLCHSHSQTGPKSQAAQAIHPDLRCQAAQKHCFTNQAAKTDFSEKSRFPLAAVNKTA
jgi:hypothetical protein